MQWKPKSRPPEMSERKYHTLFAFLPTTMTSGTRVWLETYVHEERWQYLVYLRKWHRDRERDRLLTKQEYVVEALTNGRQSE